MSSSVLWQLIPQRAPKYIFVRSGKINQSFVKSLVMALKLSFRETELEYGMRWDTFPQTQENIFAIHLPSVMVRFKST